MLPFYRAGEADPILWYVNTREATSVTLSKERYGMRLTERENKWIKAYFKAEGNATEATRMVYGGTPGACRVKGHKKVKKFKAILREIERKGFSEMEYQGMSGIDFYLGNLQREAGEARKFWKEVGGIHGFAKMLR